MSIKLLCLGDVMLGENASHYNRGIRSKFHPEYKRLIPESLSQLIYKDVDLIFYNLEYAIAEHSEFSNKTILENIFKGYPETVSLFESRPVVVSVANNHFGQHGPTICRFAKQLLEDKGIHVVGGSEKPTVIMAKEKKILFWGVTLVEDKYDGSEYFKSTYTNLIKSLNLPEIKSKDEHWVISVHWGDEYMNTPSVDQSVLGKELIDRGFDLIIGHHPHTIQPVEFYKDKLIIYSLGNFIFDQSFSRRTRTGLVLHVLLKQEPVILNAFLSQQKNYMVQKLMKIPLKSINYKISFKLYNTKKKVLNYWYRILMKLEVLLNLNEVDRETLHYYRSKVWRKK